MNDFLKTNKKYLIILAFGLVLLTTPMISKNTADKSCEKRFIEVMKSAKGVGEIDVMTGTNDEGLINGVVIVAQGADDINVKKQISDAACVAFDVQPHKIQVFSYNEEAMLNEIK